jgi:hypothetical protein
VSLLPFETAATVVGLCMNAPFQDGRSESSSRLMAIGTLGAEFVQVLSVFWSFGETTAAEMWVKANKAGRLDRGDSR